QWSPSGLSVLTGANGSGKTTVLMLLKALRASFDRGVAEAVAQLGGAFDLRHHAAPPDEPMVLGIDDGDLSWRIRIVPRGAGAGFVVEETLKQGNEEVFRYGSLANHYRGTQDAIPASATERLVLRWLSESHPDDKALARMA